MRSIITLIILMANTSLANAADVRIQTASAGPANINSCVEQTGLHVRNYFDVAYEYAQMNALEDCVKNNFREVVTVSYLNHGLQGDPSDPYSICDCKVELHYTCQ